jgi:hypothetical protein
MGQAKDLHWPAPSRTCIVVVTTDDKTGSRQALRFRDAAFEDYERIAALATRNGLEFEGREQWVHLWANNPACQLFPNWPMGWVVEGENADIVGYHASVPQLFELDGRRLIASAARTLVVDAPYRNCSFQLLRYFFQQKQADLLLATTANAQAAKAHGVFRALRVPSGTWDRTAFWATNYRGFIASVLAMKHIPGAKALSIPLSAGLLLRDALKGRPAKKLASGFELSYCQNFDEPFEEFWQSLRRSYPHRLLANRSRETLVWHFKYPLANNGAWVLTATKGSRLAAYAIFLRMDNLSYSLTRMRLVDFQVLEGNTELLNPLLCEAMERCRRERIHMLETIGFSPPKQRVIDSLSPAWRTLDSWRYFYKACNSQLAETLKDPHVWDPSCFDGDASFLGRI